MIRIIMIYLLFDTKWNGDIFVCRTDYMRAHLSMFIMHKYTKINFNKMLSIILPKEKQKWFKRVGILSIFSGLLYWLLFYFLPKNEPSWTLFWLFLFKVNFFIAVIISLYQSYSYDVHYTIILFFSLYSLKSRWLLIMIIFMLGYTTIITLFHIISKSYHQIIGKHTQLHLQFSWSPQWIITYSFIHCLVINTTKQHYTFI